MATKKVRELRQLKKEELLKLRSDLQQKLLQIRFRSRIEKPANPMEKRNIRREIAVINTLLREMELKQAKEK
ncbi:LSU ribosomal protein L29p [Brevinematales bacterium NS]|jgi:large subunit ribosomal protein L29|nr:50S ribosomal protein L29 [Brevinematales bacterium]QJR22363.1 LSU ribosomal protein L29p [Brevinematales bacterium NS]